MPRYPFINRLRIEGYKVFREFQATLGPLEVIVGSNGSGKTSLFEFLRFLRDGVQQDIPSEIVRGSIGQRIFHGPGPDKFSWQVHFDFLQETPLLYLGELLGPVGQPKITYETVKNDPAEGQEAVEFLTAKAGVGNAQEPARGKGRIAVGRRGLALRSVANPDWTTLFRLQKHITRWQFYSSFTIAMEKIRRPIPVEAESALDEDGGNLSSVLHYLKLERQDLVQELEQFIRLAIPGFQGLSVKAAGGRGAVMAYWKEEGVDDWLSLADLSDGTLRFLCWAVLCVHPHPPSLVCIDEPDMGIHPRAQALLAGMFQKASERTQFILATHGSYFLMQFDLSQIAVLRKDGGEAKFVRPADSEALKANLEEFGREEIELMHRNEELEHLA